MAINANLADMRLKIRKLTGMLSNTQITDNELDDYINSFYEYDLPKHLKLLMLKNDYTITLQPNIDQYTLDDYVQTIQEPMYTSGYDTKFYEDKQVFYQIYPEMKQIDTLAVGNGTPGPYAGNASGKPIIKRSIFASSIDDFGDAISSVDNGTGAFGGDGFGAIDYMTGAMNIVWARPIQAGAPIYIQYNAYQAARPQSVLLNVRTLIVRPIPDMSYQLVMTAFVKPTALSTPANETPLLKDWWQLIAYGAALKIFADNLDMENYQKVDMLFDKQMCLVERRTLKQLSTQRARTIFSEYEYSARYSQFL